VASAQTHSPRPDLQLYPAAPTADPRSNRRREVTAQVARYLGAVHAQQYYEAYFSIVPTIGTLFLLSFIGAGIVGTTLFLPVRLLGRRVGDLILSVAALGAIGIAFGTLVSLLISEYRPLFGFMESGYRLAIVLTLLFDGLTIVFLGLFLALVGPPLIRSLRPVGTEHRQAPGP